MNVALEISDVVMEPESSGCKITGSISDPTGKYTTKSIATLLVGCKAFIMCTVSGSTTYGEFEITELITSARKSFEIRLQNKNDLNMETTSIAKAAHAFICSTTAHGVDDVPDGAFLGISASLTAWARTRNTEVLINDIDSKIAQGTGKKQFTQVVYTADIVTDENAEEGRKHYVTLTHTPTEDEVILEINGVRSYENELNGNGDFRVDRENKLLYLDAYLNDFSFEDLVESAAEMRVQYMYVDE